LNKISSIISLLRVQQWYKNIIIFFGIVFALELISPTNIFISILGFIALCLITSAGYIRNDIIDLQQDKTHPEKCKRPLPSGQITLKKANIIFLIILGIGLLLSFSLDLLFGVFMTALIINTEIYSRITKNIVFLDIFVIGLNFVIRAVSGIVLINTPISPLTTMPLLSHVWIVFGVFFVALFLGFMKRKSELITLKNSADSHRKVLSHYTKISLNISVFISAIVILAIFTIYSVIGPFDDGRLILTVPFIALIILRLSYLSKINHILIQKNEFYKDKLTAIAIISYSIFTLILLYTDFYSNFILTNL
jgi:4-hydroxybenzoate polyprenyltransferase